MPKQVIGGSVVDEEMPLSVSVIDTPPTKHVISGSVVDAELPLAVSIVAGGLPLGAIVMWSGLLADIPAGWQLCDGTNGTPDLRSNFVRGAAPGDEPSPDGRYVRTLPDPAANYFPAYLLLFIQYVG
jgi:hypothetical protein